MASLFLKGCSTAVLLLIAAATLPGRAEAQRICPDPALPCGDFKPYEMPFRVPPSRRARAEERSAPFYAVILKTAARCGIPESERLSAQALFPGRKVFVSRFECDGEDNITYTTIDDGRHSVLAVSAGGTRREAQRFLAGVRGAGRFPGAYLRRMQVVLVFP